MYSFYRQDCFVNHLYLAPPRRLCFCSGLCVCLSVCVSVSVFVQKISKSYEQTLMQILDGWAWTKEQMIRLIIFKNLQNHRHCLHPHLPPIKPPNHNLRPKGHIYQIQNYRITQTFLHPTLPIPVLLISVSIYCILCISVFCCVMCFTILTAFIDHVRLLHVF